MNLKKKAIMITGAASGNGRAIAIKAAYAGAVVVLLDKDGVGLEETSTIIQKKGGSALTFKVEFAEKNNYLEKISEYLVKNKITKIDGLVNNAGITKSSHFTEYKKVDWDITIYVNLTSVFLLSQMIVKNYASKSGSIVNITSLAAEQGFPNNPAYVASKGGLKMLTKQMAYDLAKFNYRVNAVGPGYIKTEMTKISYNDSKLNRNRLDRMLLDRWGESTDIANTVIFLLSEKSSYVTGQDFYVDGGWLAKGL